LPLGRGLVESDLDLAEDGGGLTGVEGAGCGVGTTEGEHGERNAQGSGETDGDVG
jgi:hypothetical protein